MIGDPANQAEPGQEKKAEPGSGFRLADSPRVGASLEGRALNQVRFASSLSGWLGAKEFAH